MEFAVYELHKKYPCFRTTFVMRYIDTTIHFYYDKLCKLFLLPIKVHGNGNIKKIWRNDT